MRLCVGIGGVCVRACVYMSANIVAHSSSCVRMGSLRFIGKAVFDRQLIDLPLSHCVCVRLLGKVPTIKDLEVGSVCVCERVVWACACVCVCRVCFFSHCQSFNDR